MKTEICTSTPSLLMTKGPDKDSSIIIHALNIDIFISIFIVYFFKMNSNVFITLQNSDSLLT